MQDRLNVSQWKEDKLFSELENVRERLSGTTKCLQIMSNDNFDLIFSILYYFEDVPLSIKKELILTLNSALKFLLKSLEKRQLLNEDSAMNHRKSIASGVSMSGRSTEIDLFRNSLKAYVYLISWFLSDFSKLKEAKELQTKMRRKNQKKERSASGDSQQQYLNEIKMQSVLALTFFLDIMESDI